MYKKDTWKRPYHSCLCRCDCGVETIVIASNLINGEIRSCGCLYQDPEVVEKRRKKIYETRAKNNNIGFSCLRCGAEKHFAKGLCVNCYASLRNRGLLDDWIKYHEIKSEEDLYFNRKDSGVDKWMMQLNDRIRQEKEEAYV